ncbi:hypothetical protein Syun_012080 [Stephania yunnanensis]|uniref:Secreted protein n=1 Tax=Stephania yunnanensis TaxID=152371 RepID=A0AAP0K116_9MAGN
MTPTSPLWLFSLSEPSSATMLSLSWSVAVEAVCRCDPPCSLPCAFTFETEVHIHQIVDQAKRISTTTTEPLECCNI